VLKELTSLPGYPMAKNLRAKIAETDELLVNDVNSKATQDFAQEVGEGKKTSICNTPREVAQRSVRFHRQQKLL
jgi:3-hydroxyisobutyrate/3-hydroxypropionate dehydrogenase